MQTALVYDRVNKWGGAERVLLALHEMFPEAPLYTSVYDPARAPWAKVFPKIHTSFLQKIPFAKGNHEFFGTFMPLAFESFDFSGYDLVISVTSEAAKGVITRPSTKHICICLTPTRYLWSHYDTYFKGPIFKGIAKPFVNYLRRWDKIAAQRPDVMVAISTEVNKRIKKYYNRDSEIIFPPVGLRSTAYGLRPKNAVVGSLSAESYYLVVSRLVPYKRVDLAVEVFNKLKLPLVIIGTGSEQRKLKSMSTRNAVIQSNIKFVGQVSEKELVDYYLGAKALIMPQEEDFGIVSVEAQAQGTPVIAYKKGGVLDTVIDGITGVFFERQTITSLTSAVKRFEKMKFDPEVLRKNATGFGKERFKRGILEAVSKIP